MDLNGKNQHANSIQALEDCSAHVLDMFGSIDPLLLSQLKETIAKLNETQRSYIYHDKDEVLPDLPSTVEKITPMHMVGPLLKSLGSAFLPPSITVELWDQGFR